tara:strand:- start:6541 stop:6993 length:453 start_codon:yes stop_codon:yes gene_type:complete
MKITVMYKEQPSILMDSHQVINAEELFNDVEDASCVDIRCERVLDEIVYHHRDEALSNIVSKLRYGGTISLEGVDYAILCKNVMLGKHAPLDLNTLLYADSRQSLSYLLEMTQKLEALGLKVDTSKYSSDTDTYECPFYTIEAHRPNVEK